MMTLTMRVMRVMMAMSATIVNGPVLLFLIMRKMVTMRFRCLTNYSSSELSNRYSSTMP